MISYGLHTTKEHKMLTPGRDIARGNWKFKSWKKGQDMMETWDREGIKQWEPPESMKAKKFIEDMSWGWVEPSYLYQYPP